MLETVPTDLSKLSDVVKNDVVRKTEYDGKIKDIQMKYLVLLTYLPMLFLMLK